MNNSNDSLFTRMMAHWEAKILNHPRLLLIASVIFSGFVFQYTTEHLTINTNTADMISIKLPFQQDRIRLEKAFPQDASTILMLVEGKTPEQTAAFIKSVTQKLGQDKQAIASLYVPDDNPFFDQNGLLYLDVNELQSLSNKLASAQPFIGRLAQNYSLAGLFDTFTDALTNNDTDIDINAIFGKTAEAIEAALANQPYRVSWQQLMMDKASGLGFTKRFVFIKPILNFQEFLPAEKSLIVINQAVTDSLKDELAGVNVRLTGEVILEHEEMLTVSQGTAAAGVASMVLVCIILWIAYRSFKLMFATFFTLSMGLILSLGFAALAIGHLNMISIAFGVLFIGMGDAYSSHFCLRYLELRQRNVTTREAILQTLTSTGSSLMLCTITASIGLFAFIPTNYVGVSELGVIAGTSLVIALITTFTVLPAVIKIMPPNPKATYDPEKKPPAILSNWPIRYARPIRWITILLTLGALILLTRIEVDFNPINLRDPDTESVKTFKYLLASKDTSPMTLTSLGHSEEQTHKLQAEFEKLPVVEKVMTLFDFIPQNQDEKLGMIEELGLILGPGLEQFPDIQPGPANLQPLLELQKAIKAKMAQGESKGVSMETLTRLNSNLDQLLVKLQAESPEQRQIDLNTLQNSFLSALPTTIKILQHNLQANTVTLASLPADIKDRWLSKDGLYRIQIYPKKDLNDLDSLREFIVEAQTIDSHVSDLPVTYLESMNEVIRAFVQAFSVALGVITLILLVIMRNIKDTLLVLLPLMLASLYTAAITVLIGMPFNFANIIALPLLFGLGVDSGIHMAHRLRYLNKSDENLFSSSEALGVFYGTLTTIFSFGSLAFTSHEGMASMGVLLAVGLLLTLICALVVLPAFSALRFEFHHHVTRNHAK